jgi:hypothetical protein
MRLFIQELKKILRPLPLLVLAVSTGLFSFVFMESPFGYMTEYHETSDMVKLSADLIELAGPMLEPEEIEPAVETLSARYISEIETEIRKEPLFAAAGVSDYAGYRDLENKIGYSFLFPTAEERKDMSAESLRNLEEERERVANGESVYADYDPFDPNRDYTLTTVEQEIKDKWLMNEMVPAIKLKLLTKNLASEYERIKIDGEWYPEHFVLTESAAIQAHLMKIYESGAIRSILPGWAMSQINQIYPMLAIMILTALCILLSPFITKDNMNGITTLQYSSKAGRKTLGVQFAAMLFTVFVIAVVEIAVVFGLFIGKGWHNFLDSGLNSFWDPFNFNWFAGNYGQYLFIIAIMILAVSFAAAMLIFFLSKLCKNYISLILGLVPLAAALIFLCYQVFKRPFAIMGDMGSSLYRIIPIPYVEAYIAGLLLLIGIVFSAAMLKRQKRAEIV